MARKARKNHTTHHSTHHSAHHSSSRHHARHTNGEHGRHVAEEMISAGQKEIGQMQKGARSAYHAFDLFSGPMSHMMGQNWSMFQKMFQAMQEESLHFFNRRLEHTSHVIENSRDFHGVSGLMQLQQEWILDFARDYSEQATRVARRVRDLAADSTELLAEASSEALEDSESEYDREQGEGEEKGHHAAA